METCVIARHEKCISMCHKDHRTVYMLIRLAQNPSQLKLVELDITTQTICSTTVCLVFEGVQNHDVNYSLIYSSGFLVMIYPT